MKVMCVGGERVLYIFGGGIFVEWSDRRNNREVRDNLGDMEFKILV